MGRTISVRLPKSLEERLTSLARTLDRPKTYIISKALQEYLDEYTDYLIAMDRLSDKDDGLISGEELLGLDN
ncbi:MAG: ribbon-helix-helix protein, CopG family [Nitrososphaerota archaeon]|jgi:RHH-type rel operon transcriptional repressor/antitoxin RelB|nr:ribbon-helix-helix protein, CopG family [Nitrososphaerota archaeon]MDG7041394.1 ribbon-helix-helix protein, CopG family [Nitrososphaerota archaeon]MDG7043640.1 ribbon-helix-helix protein, CopG family [Nitrososphaerota archaeon]